MTTEDQTELKESEATTESIEEKPLATVKRFAVTIGGVILVLSILVLLPMFFTYLSEGDSRAPSEIHATDTAAKKTHSVYKSNQ